MRGNKLVVLTEDDGHPIAIHPDRFMYVRTDGRTSWVKIDGRNEAITCRESVSEIVKRFNEA